MRHDRIFFFGDSITLGADDSTGLAWPMRLCRGLTTSDGREVAVYNLGINGDTSAHIAARWRAEAEARSREAWGLFVFAFGFNDAARPDDGPEQVSLEASIANARAIVTAARALSDVLWIGPTPLDESVNPMVTAYASWDMRNDLIARYDAAYAALAAELSVPYLRLFEQFRESDRYAGALAAADKVHPADEGYAMIAECVAGWKAWQVITAA